MTEPSDTEPLDALWGAYRATTYTARFPTAVVRIRVGAACAGLDLYHGRESGLRTTV